MIKPRAFLTAPVVLSLLLGLSLPGSYAAESDAGQPPQSPLTAIEVERLIIEGQTNYDHGRYKAAVQSFEQAKKLGTSSDYQKSLLSLGLAEAYRQSGNYKDAEALFKSAIEEAEEEDQKHLDKRYKANHKRSSDLVPTMMSDLSVLYLDQSRFPECEQVIKSSIDIATKKVGPNDSNLALPLNSLTRLYIKWGKLTDAKSVNNRTLALFNTPTSKNSWLYLYTAYNLAQILNERGKYKEAELLYKATLTGIQSQFGLDHQYCAIVQESLGELYRKESRYAEATKEFQNVRRIREASLSKEHPDYGKALLDLALVYRDEGRYAKAQDRCQQATTIIEHALGQNNVEIAKCWITEASIDRYQGRYADAEDLARRARQLDEKLLTADHPTCAHDMVELANILADEGKFAEAEDLLNKSLAVSKLKLGAEHPDITITVQSLAHVYFAEKQYGKAEPMYRESLALAEKTLGPDHAQVIDNLRDLSELLIFQKRYDDAEPLMKRAIEIDEKLFGKTSAQLAGDLGLLADLYIKQNKKDQARRLLAQASQISHALPGGIAVRQYASETLGADSAKDTTVSDKWAVLVGISNFRDPSINLKYAAKDATDFRNFLVTQESFRADHVRLLTDGNATKDKIMSSIGDGWLGKLAQPDDLVLVYVSSHGSASKEDVGVNFLVAEDTDKTKLISTGLPMQWLTKMIQEQVHSRRVILILDVCHSGSAGDQSKNDSDSDDNDSDSTDNGGKGLAVADQFNAEGLNLGSGQIVLSSSLAEQVSWESKSYPNGVFTRRLIEALQCRGKDTSLREAYEQLKARVGAEVLSDRGVVQTPNLFNKNWSGGDPVLGVAASNPRMAKQ